MGCERVRHSVNPHIMGPTQCLAPTVHTITIVFLIFNSLPVRKSMKGDSNLRVQVAHG